MARVTLANYARWFEQTFSEFQATAMASGISGSGIVHPSTGTLDGVAHGGPGFLTDLRMRD